MEALEDSIKDRSSETARPRPRFPQASFLPPSTLAVETRLCWSGVSIPKEFVEV
jgi:hypothetical protein